MLGLYAARIIKKVGKKEAIRITGLPHYKLELLKANRINITKEEEEKLKLLKDIPWKKLSEICKIAEILLHVILIILFLKTSNLIFILIMILIQFLNERAFYRGLFTKGGK